MWRCPVGDAVTIDAGAGWRLTLPLPAASLYRRWEEIEWRLPLAPEKTREDHRAALAAYVKGEGR